MFLIPIQNTDRLAGGNADHEQYECQNNGQDLFPVHGLGIQTGTLFLDSAEGAADCDGGQIANRLDKGLLDFLVLAELPDSRRSIISCILSA